MSTAILAACRRRPTGRCAQPHALTPPPAPLAGIGSTRRSDRLRGLEEAGVIRKGVLPPPATVPVYELTAGGERLRDPLLALGLWGLDLPLDDRVDPGTTPPALIA